MEKPNFTQVVLFIVGSLLFIGFLYWTSSTLATHISDGITIIKEGNK